MSLVSSIRQATVGETGSTDHERALTVRLLPINGGADDGVEGRYHKAAVVGGRRRVINGLQNSVHKFVHFCTVSQTIVCLLRQCRILQLQVHSDVLGKNLSKNVKEEYKDDESN